MNKRAVKTASLASALLGVMAIGGIAAYFTDADTATNTFTVGRVSLDLVEPNYPGNDSEEVKNLVPNEEVKKDPTIINDGVNDEYVFLEVYVPYDTVLVADADGSILKYTNNADYSITKTGNYDAGTVDKSGMTKQIKQLFEYTINNGWIEVDAATGAMPANGAKAQAQLIPGVIAVAAPGQGIFGDATGATSGNVTLQKVFEKDAEGHDTQVQDTSRGMIRHLFAYAVADGDKAVMTALKSESAVVDSGLHEPDASAPTRTSALFNGVRLANIIEDEYTDEANVAQGDRVEQTTQSIVINAYGIQADFINNGDTQNNGSPNNEEGESVDTGKKNSDDVWSVVKAQAPSTAINFWQDGLSQENPTTDAKEAAPQNP
jgi:predicted ribosomally synthesized peptide with SipW-like signal peptide